jgi:hypothetical protein
LGRKDEIASQFQCPVSKSEVTWWYFQHHENIKTQDIWMTVAFGVWLLRASVFLCFCEATCCAQTASAVRVCAVLSRLNRKKSRLGDFPEQMCDVLLLLVQTSILLFSVQTLQTLWLETQKLGALWLSLNQLKKAIFLAFSNHRP